MSNEIKLLVKDEKDKRDDLQLINEFYKFLQGEIPKGISMRKHFIPKLTSKKAFSVIWFLQEYLSVFPDTIERCNNCEELFDTRFSNIIESKDGNIYDDYCR